tara:strand:+ start:130 stop:279 length:150 start_codon:yes stop_codon:yes gene_type:complete
MPKKLIAFRITKENQIVMEMRRDRKKVSVTKWINDALAKTYPPYDPDKK